jgi:hypothetical protein
MGLSKKKEESEKKKESEKQSESECFLAFPLSFSLFLAEHLYWSSNCFVEDLRIFKELC